MVIGKLRHGTDDSRSRPKTTENLYIYSDLCKESIVHGAELPLLRRLDKNKKERLGLHVGRALLFTSEKKGSERISHLYKTRIRYLRVRLERDITSCTSFKALSFSLKSGLI